MVKIREKSGCDSKSGTNANSRPPAVPIFVLVCALFLTGSNFMRMVNGNDYLFRLSGKPGSPGMPAFTEATPTTVTLLWQPPSDDPLFPTKHYLVHTFIGLERKFEPQLTMTSVQTKFQVKGLKPSTIYSFRVASVRGETVGSFSDMSIYVRTLKEPRTQVPTMTTMPTKEKSSTTTIIVQPPTTTTKIPSATAKKVPGKTTAQISGTTTAETIPGTTTTMQIPGTTTATTTKEREELIRDPWIVFFILVTTVYLIFCITGYYYRCRRSPRRTIERGQAAMEALDAPRVNDPLLEAPVDMAILPGTNE